VELVGVGGSGEVHWKQMGERLGCDETTGRILEWEKLKNTVKCGVEWEMTPGTGRNPKMIKLT